MLMCIIRALSACFSHEDLREMLDSNKDNLKLEAMKRIIGVSHLVILPLKRQTFSQKWLVVSHSTCEKRSRFPNRTLSK